jgi:Ca-activated chloride channel family protein
VRVAPILTAVPLSVALLTAASAGQSERPHFRTAIELTTVTATVLDEQGNLVTGLSQSAFEVFEDGTLQTITQFTNERVPVSLALLLDTSDSMFGARLVDARQAVEHFVGELLPLDDEWAMISFNHKIHSVSEWTDDRSRLRPLLERLIPSGATAIYDAVAQALPLTAVRHRQRAAIIIVSDGADTASDTTLRDLRSALLRTDAFVYAVAIDSPKRGAINTSVNPGALRAITDQSGGRTLVVGGSGELTSALETIAEELNSQYLLGYTSPHPADGKYHTIRVRVNDRTHRVRARSGYVADR